MKRRAAVVLTLLGVVVTAGCTDSDEPSNVGVSASSDPGSTASSMTLEEAYRKLPIDGPANAPINWEKPQEPESEEVLAARRSLALWYWERSSTDWTEIVPIGRFLFTDRFYQQSLAPFADVTNNAKPSSGPLWVKTMGVEKTGTDQARVTFCTDRGHWRDAGVTEVPHNRANLESYVLNYEQTGDGERRWLTDRLIDNAVDRTDQYGAECTKWAQHQS
ncbi:hypothetical protein Q0Z83_040070 [Actinoplanes sichuanensis]|uniref:hypothetical protein n=1 Tax=Actinoplanes sichuanensis TaxID=512349 RepID=UPI002955C39C|nr:hypothetical protein [Actinoplanes sichuanensis]BEL05816.1 hypothetical protein Q0Z83_040070 [Actinoplanes sichuanensis]